MHLLLVHDERPILGNQPRSAPIHDFVELATTFVTFIIIRIRELVEAKRAGHDWLRCTTGWFFPRQWYLKTIL